MKKWGKFVNILCFLLWGVWILLKMKKNLLRNSLEFVKNSYKFRKFAWNFVFPSFCFFFLHQIFSLLISHESEYFFMRRKERSIYMFRYLFLLHTKTNFDLILLLEKYSQKSLEWKWQIDSQPESGWNSSQKMFERERESEKEKERERKEEKSS